MSDAARLSRQFGEGPLSRIAALVYTLLVVEALLVVVTLPSLALLLLLDRDASNIPLAALCAVPLGPGLSAALFALRRRSRDLSDLKPAAAFWRGYRLNVRGVLLIWIPALIWLSVIATGLAGFGSAGLPGWWAVLLALIGFGSLLWLMNALVITSLFAFRARDVARLAVYFLLRTPKVTLGNAGVLVTALATTLLTNEAVVGLFATVLLLLLLNSSGPMITAVTDEFTQ
jgi:hypothetical protein